jgi:hypothetical protein
VEIDQRVEGGRDGDNEKLRNGRDHYMECETKTTYQKDGNTEVEYGRIVASERLIRQLAEAFSYTETNVLDSRTYYCDDEGNPHQEVESAEDVVENLLPILSPRWGDHILAFRGLALDGLEVKTENWVAGIPCPEL